MKSMMQKDKLRTSLFKVKLSIHEWWAAFKANLRMCYFCFWSFWSVKWEYMGSMRCFSTESMKYMNWDLKSINLQIWSPKLLQSLKIRTYFKILASLPHLGFLCSFIHWSSGVICPAPIRQEMCNFCFKHV